MNNTKHDLSADEVAIDYQALIETAAYAFIELREKLNRELHIMFTIGVTTHNLACSANAILEVSKKLAIAAETYHALVEGKSREKFAITNKYNL